MTIVIWDTIKLRQLDVTLLASGFGEYPKNLRLFAPCRQIMTCVLAISMSFSEYD